MNRPTIASFFAGIGGFDLGFEQVGFAVNFQCEVQAFCRSVLSHHWSGVPIASNISNVSSKEIPDADVWCGGFPCQDLSVARGSLGRHGLNGSRSGLFFRFAALVKAKTPRVILIENVHGLLNSNDGKDFAELLSVLENLGYAVSWRLLNTRYFGLPQSRPRVYICAWLSDPGLSGNALFENRPPLPTKHERDGFLETSWDGGVGPITPRIAFCLSATSGRHTGTDWSRTYVAYGNEVRRLTPLECERLQGFPDNWTRIEVPDTDLDRADSLRYHALGNAASVAVVRWVASRIKANLRNQRATVGKKIDRRHFLSTLLPRWPGLCGPRQAILNLETVRQSSAKFVWPNAGVLWTGTVVTNQTPASIHKPNPSDLLDIIQRDRPDARYFLSPNAAEGILRRVDGQDRKLFPPLRSALERLAGRRPTAIEEAKEPRQLDLRLPEIECV